MSAVLGLDRVTFNPAVMGGRACIRGLRITVALVVNLIANGMTIPDIIREYPDLEPGDIEQALRYAAFIADDEILPLAEETANVNDPVRG
jgi:uncharacterized protein (DUF433 family)